jgi:hypothetical protein
MRYALILSLGFMLLSAGPAYASCPHWNLSGDALSVGQTNGYSVFFNIQQDGKNLSGSALSDPQNYSGKGKTLSGNLKGTLTGAHVEMSIYWAANDEHPATAGVYNMDIDEAGRISGETYDFEHPTSRARVFGIGPVQCVQADAAPPPPAPDTRPVARLGKRHPSTPASPVVLFIPKSDSCAQGFVWREAGPSDKVCVPYASRDRAAAENARAASLWSAGAYGPKTCVSGFVWREAFDGDVVCVTPDVRAQVLNENELGPSRHGQ